MALEKNIEIQIKYILDDFSKVELRQINDTIKDALLIPFKVQKAYIKINTLSGTKEKMNIGVNVFNSEKNILIQSNCYAFTPNVTDQSDNFIKQGYEYLKTLPEFTGAIDVLEDGQML